ncbi:cysteine protease StiP domain-containing protein [Vibrio splendidus]
MILHLADLDNCLIETLRNVELIEAQSRGYMVLASKQSMLTVMNPQQLDLFNSIRATGLLVPVTGRQAYQIPKTLRLTSYAVAAHGAQIVKPDRTIDQDWEAHLVECQSKRGVMSLIEPLRPWSDKSVPVSDSVIFKVMMCGPVVQSVRLRMSSADYRVHDCPEQEIDIALDWLVTQVPMLRLWSESRNGRQCELLAPGVSKAKAVDHIVDLLSHEYNDMTLIGYGDSSSDVPFITKCHFMMTPTQGQIMSDIKQTTPDVNNSELPLGFPGIIGSYPASDCLFLLKEIPQNFVEVDDKERLIQSGEMHYSEMVSQEEAPSSDYMTIYRDLMDAHGDQIAMEVIQLAKEIVFNRLGYGLTPEQPLVLVSLLRAGTPIGVLLNRTLEMMGFHSIHYSISIIRDRGIDDTALSYICENYQDESIVFIDGWTAKGVITRELKSTIGDFNRTHNTSVPDQLFVISDIGGSADVSVTAQDYAMPSCLLNSVISGLVSRSVLGKNEQGLHGCVRYDHLQDHDVSNRFINQIMNGVPSWLLSGVPEVNLDTPEVRQQRVVQFLVRIQSEFGVTDINRIKPGIAEATRVMLRRVPDVLLVQSMDDPSVRHLHQIAKEKAIEVIEYPDMPFGACGLIKDIL